MTGNENILKTIEKLERLGDPSRNSNPHEARSAREKAKALRREWNIPRKSPKSSRPKSFEDITSTFRQYNSRKTPSWFDGIPRSTFVAGFRYYDGPDLIHRFAVGQRVYLVPRPDNPYDALAIAVFWRGHMVGYVPRKKNKRLSKELAKGALFYARISGVFPDAEPWEALQIEITTMPLSPMSRKRLTMRCSERLRLSRWLLPPPPFRPPCSQRASLRRR